MQPVGHDAAEHAARLAVASAVSAGRPLPVMTRTSRAPFACASREEAAEAAMRGAPGSCREGRCGRRSSSPPRARRLCACAGRAGRAPARCRRRRLCGGAAAAATGCALRRRRRLFASACAGGSGASAATGLERLRRLGDLLPERPLLLREVAAPPAHGASSRPAARDEDDEAAGRLHGAGERTGAPRRSRRRCRRGPARRSPSRCPARPSAGGSARADRAASSRSRPACGSCAAAGRRRGFARRSAAPSRRRSGRAPGSSTGASRKKMKERFRAISAARLAPGGRRARRGCVCMVDVAALRARPCSISTRPIGV